MPVSMIKKCLHGCVSRKEKGSSQNGDDAPALAPTSVTAPTFTSNQNRNQNQSQGQQQQQRQQSSSAAAGRKDRRLQPYQDQDDQPTQTRPDSVTLNSLIDYSGNWNPTDVFRHRDEGIVASDKNGYSYSYSNDNEHGTQSSAQFSSSSAKAHDLRNRFPQKIVAASAN